MALRPLLKDPSYFMEKGETTRLSEEEGRLGLARREEEKKRKRRRLEIGTRRNLLKRRSVGEKVIDRDRRGWTEGK